MKKSILLFAICLVAIPGLFAQKSPEKFGKNIEESLNSSACPIDSSAGAYVIFDFGKTHFEYDSEDGFSWVLNRHLRLKILNKNELDQASFTIPIYEHTNGREQVLNLKAASYNLVDGKIIQNSIGKKDGYTEEKNEYWNYFKFAVPKAEEGSIIEVNYKLKSPFKRHLRDWNFQWDIPVLHSEIYIGIPEYYEYHQNMKGYNPLAVFEETQESGSLMLIQKGETVIENGVQKRYKPTSKSVDYMVNAKHFVAKNLPALKQEDFVDNIENYRSSVEFELSRTKFGGDIEVYTTSWEAVTHKLMEAYNFGQKLDKVGYAKDALDNLIASYPDKRELLNAIYSFVQQKVKWNEATGLVVDGTLREIYNSGSGRAADINFILINMLKEAGFNALPVAISTRSNGIILPTFPTMGNFNNMIVLVILDGENILLDASTSYCPPGILPTRCLNGQGRLIDLNYNSWIDLAPSSKYDELLMYDLKIGELGNFSGKMNSNLKGYASIGFRGRYDQALSREEMIEKMEEDNPGLEILDDSISGMENPYGPVQLNYNIEISERANFFGDMISFNPLLFEQIQNNPFKLEDRKFPVNFTYPRKYMYIFKYELPEGFEVETLPASINMSSPDKSLRFMYSASQIGNLVNLTVVYQVNKTLFIPDEYLQLKEFYNLMVAKHAEPVIIKKTTSP